ncbi:uncharacterized protein B0H64DRAFT_350409 [Chaetomium fimeti]|uniref:Uncharacterized protein n=1 Tax=Chaetomium fimeti TaxID=1854472 RepID=A0AAE0H5Q4_9PEZI|nr:hypothetical protein B0H64DRAFT_350409 [Chaetomium fimeti]
MQLPALRLCTPTISRNHLSHFHGQDMPYAMPLPHLEQGGRRRSDMDATFVTGETGDNPRHRAFAAKDYADRVRNHAATTVSQCLHPGDSFRNLADFLLQPYIQRAPQLPLLQTRSPSAPVPTPTPTPNLNSTSLGATEPRVSRFAALYQASKQGVFKLPFDTVREFEDLGDSALPGAGSFALLLLQGYPSPEWLNTLGARFGIDPEFFQRHLVFTSGSAKGGVGGRIPKRTATHILPSCHGDMVSLQVTRIGSRQSASVRHTSRDQEGLDQLRRQASEEMAAYMSKLASLNSPGVAAADSIVREFSVHGLDYFSLEQTVSLGIHQLGQGWIGIIWHDAGNPLDKSLQGPWQTRAIRSDSFEVTYLPISVHTPGVALKSKKRKGGTGTNATSDSTRDGLRPGIDDTALTANMTPMERILDEYARTVDLSRAVHDPFYALSPLFSFAVSSEMEVLDLIDAKVRDELDHSSMTGDGVASTSPTLSNLLYSQQVLKRHIRNLQAPISYMEALCSSLSSSAATTPRTAAITTIRTVLADYRFALAYADALAADCVQGMSIMAHNAAIRESQKAIAEARGVTRLTRLATLFVPLALVTSAFSMNVREVNAGDGPPLWAWAVVSVVVGAVSWLLVRYDLSRLARWCRWRRRPVSESRVVGAGPGSPGPGIWQARFGVAETQRYV